MTEQRITGIAYNGTEYVPKADHDALAARLDQQTRDCIAAIKEAQDRGTRLAEAERLLQEWLSFADAPDYSVKPAFATEKFLAADSASGIQDGGVVG